MLGKSEFRKNFRKKKGGKKYTRGDEKRKSDVETLKIWQFGERNGLLAYYR